MGLEVGGQWRCFEVFLMPLFHLRYIQTSLNEAKEPKIKSNTCNKSPLVPWGRGVHLSIFLEPLIAMVRTEQLMCPKSKNQK